MTNEMTVKTTEGMTAVEQRDFKAGQLRQTIAVQEHNAAVTKRYLNRYLRCLSASRVRILSWHYERLMESVDDMRRELDEITPDTQQPAIN